MTPTLADAADRWPEPTWGRLLGFAALIRVLVMAVGWAVAPAGADPFYRWDAGWYERISRVGYEYHPDRQSSVAFLPLLPGLMAGAAAVGVDRHTAGLLIPNAAFAVGLAAFGRAGRQVTGSRRTAWWGCLLLTAYPHAVFFSLPYQESLFLAAAGGAVLAALDRRPMLVGVLAGLAAAARPTAIALPIGLAAQYFWDRWRGRPTSVRPAVAAAAGVAAGIGAFFGYLGWRFGDPLAHLHAHAHWGREPPSLGGLATVIRDLFTDWPNDSGSVIQARLVLIGCLVLGAVGWRRLGPLWGVLILLPVLQAASTGTLLSVERVALSAYPAALAAAGLPYNTSLRWAWLIGGAAAQVRLLQLYMRGEFIG